MEIKNILIIVLTIFFFAYSILLTYQHCSLINSQEEVMIRDFIISNRKREAEKKGFLEFKTEKEQRILTFKNGSAVKFISVFKTYSFIDIIIVIVYVIILCLASFSNEINFLRPFQKIQNVTFKLVSSGITFILEVIIIFMKGFLIKDFKKEISEVFGGEFFANDLTELCLCEVNVLLRCTPILVLVPFLVFCFSLKSLEKKDQ